MTDDFRKHFFGFVGDRDSHGNVRVVLDRLLERLLLFERVTLHSIRLHEIRELVQAFGIDGTLALLGDESFAIYCDMVTTMLGGDSRNPVTVRPLSAGASSVQPLNIGVASIDRRQLHLESFNSLNIESLSGREHGALEEAVAKKILPRATDAGRAAFEQFKTDLQMDEPLIREAGARAATSVMHREVPASAIKLRFHPIGPDSFAAENNLPAFGASDAEIKEIVISAAIAVAGLSERLEKMKRYSCLVGSHPNDLPLFERKFEFLQASINPEAQVGRLVRVIQLAGLPALHTMRVNLRRLLEVRGGQECREFRDWLLSTDSLTDAEIKQRLRSLKSKIGTFAQSGAGKIIRWLVSTGAGLAPVGGALIGPVVGALDTFLLDKAFPNTGALTFLDRQYDSLFRR